MVSGDEVVKSFSKMVEQRSGYEDIWEEAFEYSYPLRGQNLRGARGGLSSALNAKDDKAKLFDTTGKDSCRLLASSMLSGLTPPNMQWFDFHASNLGEGEVDSEGRLWLQQAARKTYKAIHSSNYDAEAYEFFLDITIGGWAGLFVDSSDDKLLKFEYWALEELFIKDSLGKNRIDTVYRRVRMTPTELREKFGNNLPQSISNQLKSGEDCKRDIIHCIRPRMKGKKQARGVYAKTMPFESIWVDAKTKAVIHEGGFLEFPVIIPRWHKIAQSDYATGAFDDALPDVKTLNQVVKLMLTNADMAIAGMFVAKDDGVLNPNSIKVGPRRFLFAADPSNVRPLTTPGNFSIATEEVQRLQTNIRRVMMSDQLQPQNGPSMTATEVQVRLQLVRQLLGPIYGRFTAEFLQPLLERVFGILLRANYLGTPPDSLGGKEFVPEYRSPLARAQRQEEVTTLTQYEMALGQQASVVGPDVLDVYDADKAAKWRANLLGVPEELLRDDRAIEARRKQRAEQQAMQEQQQ